MGQAILIHVKAAGRSVLDAFLGMVGTFTSSACRLSAALLLGALLVPFGLASPATSESVPLAGPDLSQQIAARLNSAPPLAVEGLVLDQALLTQVYRRRANAPIWAGHADWATSLEKALADAGGEAIAPEGLRLPALQQALADPALAPAERDLILTDRFLAYAQILARGHVDIGSIEDLWALPAPFFDPGAAIASLDAAGGPAGALQGLAPSSPGYERLLAAYARYTRIAAVGGLEKPAARHQSASRRHGGAGQQPQRPSRR